MTKFEYDLYKEYKEYNKKNNTSVKGGLSFCEILLVVFIVLKLCKVINWSWWWVLSPFWIPLIIWLILLIIVLIYELKHK